MKQENQGWFMGWYLVIFIAGGNIQSMIFYHQYKELWQLLLISLSIPLIPFHQ